MDGRKIPKLLLAVFLAGAQVHAQSLGIIPPNDDVYRSRISEYFYQRSGREILKPVKLLGSVRAPGLYHIPPNTTLSNLLALSGGTLPEADVNEITISRKDGTQEVTKLYKIVKAGQDPVLNDGDLVMIPKEKPWLTEHQTNAIIAITTVLSLALTTHLAFKND